MARTSQISQAALEVLSGCEIRGNEVYLQGQLDRKLYEEIKKIFINMRGKWVGGKKQAHVFEEDPTPHIDQCIRTGRITLLSKNGFFPTPEALADRMAAMLYLKPGDRVLEPSCGDGALMQAVYRSTRKRPISFTMAAYEISEQLVARCQAQRLVVNCGDILAVEMEGLLFSKVIANPPFELLADCRHLLHIFHNLLQPGGRIVSVMGAGVLFRKEKPAAEMRALIEQYGDVEELPENTFKESGTGVDTVLVWIDKPVI